MFPSAFRRSRVVAALRVVAVLSRGGCCGGGAVLGRRFCAVSHAPWDLFGGRASLVLTDVFPELGRELGVALARNAARLAGLRTVCFSAHIDEPRHGGVALRLVRAQKSG